MKVRGHWRIAIAAVICVSMFGGSSGRLSDDVVTDFEEVPTCGTVPKKNCNEGAAYEAMRTQLISAPIVEGFEISDRDVMMALMSLNNLVRYFKETCKNCVEQKVKDELCAFKDPIYQGIFDWVADTMKDSVEGYCPPEHFVCGKRHYDKCNSSLLNRMDDMLVGASKTGGEEAFNSIHELGRFFTYRCKSCIEPVNARKLCEDRKPVVAGIIGYDNDKYHDPTEIFCDQFAKATKSTKPDVCHCTIFDISKSEMFYDLK